MQEEFEGRYKDVLLETFRILIGFLDKYNLQYFVCAGTAIGAVRHKGFIPWDDDIDILMPRKDYNTLKKIFRDKDLPGYNLLTLDCANGTAPFMKFVNSNTTFWEIKELKAMSGIFIDIFPLDNFNGTLEDFMKEYRCVRKLGQFVLLSLFHFNFLSLISYIKKSKFKLALMVVLSIFVPYSLNRYFKKKILKFDNALVERCDGDAFVNFYGPYGEKEYYKREWFDSYVLCDFCDLKVKLPVNYDEYLTQMYGNYMQPPSVENRVCEHNHYYVNLKRNLTIVEAQKRINGGYTEEF